MAGLGKAGDSEPYDTAQKDEILRLAYVGITRAVSHCYWYVDAQDTQAVNMPRRPIVARARRFLSIIGKPRLEHAQQKARRNWRAFVKTKG
jgi:superfamily I DNA/RNA helicase